MLVGARFAPLVQTTTRPELPIAPCMAHHSLHGTPFEAFISLSYFLCYSYDTEKDSFTVGGLFYWYALVRSPEMEWKIRCNFKSRETDIVRSYPYCS